MMKVEVKEISFTWTGDLLWEESGYSNTKWAVIRPHDFKTHVRRGSGAREYDETLVRVPLFLGADRVTVYG